MVTEKKIKKEEGKKAVKKTTAKKDVVKKPAVKEKTNSKAVDFAVIETGGKQYLVKGGDKLKVEKIKKPVRGSVINFDKILLLFKDETVKIGTPYIKGAKIKATWLSEGKGKKITIVRYKSKTRRSRKKGHRQVYTEVVIADF